MIPENDNVISSCFRHHLNQRFVTKNCVNLKPQTLFADEITQATFMVGYSSTITGGGSIPRLLRRPTIPE